MKTIIEWNWEEAFDKFGFGDGDSWNGTGEIQSWFEDELGWTSESDSWGCHNYIIFSLQDDNGKKYEFDGYKNPRNILPKKIVKKLDEQFREAK
jgi:hypothetical protein